jgi:hypothetical protein
MSAIYEDHKDEDGFLYVTYSGENVSSDRTVSCVWPSSWHLRVALRLTFARGAQTFGC